MCHRLEDCPTLQLDNSERWTLQGHSKAGERTGFWLHPEKIVLDAGLGTQRKAKAVFLTHKHIDHTGALPYILTGTEAAGRAAESRAVALRRRRGTRH